MSLRISDEYFEELIDGIRECDDPEELFVEICDAEGNCIIFENGRLFVLSQGMTIKILLSDLSESQRYALHVVLVERVERMVDIIIAETLKNVE
jgi:hypothetical protein